MNSVMVILSVGSVLRRFLISSLAANTIIIYTIKKGKKLGYYNYYLETFSHIQRVQ